jgi:hypothetical protein
LRYNARDVQTASVPLPPCPELSSLDRAATLARKNAVQARLGTLRGMSPRPGLAEERGSLVAENAALDARLRDLAEAQKEENRRCSFAGLLSPFYKVAVKHLPPRLLAQLEAEALAMQAEADRRASERKAVRSAQEAERGEHPAPRVPTGGTKGGGALVGARIL